MNTSFLFNHPQVDGIHLKMEGIRRAIAHIKFLLNLELNPEEEFLIIPRQEKDLEGADEEKKKHEEIKKNLFDSMEEEKPVEEKYFPRLYNNLEYLENMHLKMQEHLIYVEMDLLEQATQNSIDRQSQGLMGKALEEEKEKRLDLYDLMTEKKEELSIIKEEIQYRMMENQSIIYGIEAKQYALKKARESS